MSEEHTNEELFRHLHAVNERVAQGSKQIEHQRQLIAKLMADAAVERLNKRIGLVDPRQISMIFDPQVVDDEESPTGLKLLFNSSTGVVDESGLADEIRKRHQNLIRGNSTARRVLQPGEMPESVEDAKTMMKQRRAAKNSLPRTTRQKEEQ